MPGTKSVRLDIQPGGFQVVVIHCNVIVMLGCSCSVLQLARCKHCYVVAGSDNEDTIKVMRSGGADPDGRPGDLYVTLKVSPLRFLQFSSFVDGDRSNKLTFTRLFFVQVREDPVFRREKGDIHVDTVLNVTQVIWCMFLDCVHVHPTNIVKWRVHMVLNPLSTLRK